MMKVLVYALVLMSAVSCASTREKMEASQNTQNKIARAPAFGQVAPTVLNIFH